MLKRALKYFLFTLLALVLVLWIYLGVVATVPNPVVSDADTTALQILVEENGVRRVGANWLRKSESGLYEMYVEGAPFQRGYAIGKLSKELVQYQEEVFVAQINKLVPSRAKLHFLKYFVGWFNRHLDSSVPEEYRHEIFGVSQVASHEFNYIASPYQRMLNYHAAHDIGHALQNMALVGCSSFAAWGNDAEDGQLIVGRNFDFYVGDDFAKNKIVAFYRPKAGFPFAMITFGGMTGVLSGMNLEGLTVTLNAAKSEIPSGSAVPVSLVAREMLQYAATIEEAIAIAQKRKMFVAESFLISSARDGRAVLIEKTPDALDVFESASTRLVCTNHFQSQGLGGTQLNEEHKKTSASLYRWHRLEQLLDSAAPLTPAVAATVLRNKKGLEGKEIGLGNEKALNQLIAHHSVIFKPTQRKMWVSTAPWQLGKYVCYDLNEVFSDSLKMDSEIYSALDSIPSDAFKHTLALNEFKKFAAYRFPFHPRENMVGDSLVKWNPQSYHAWMLAGDAAFQNEAFRQAAAFYRTALTKEVATLHERTYIEKQIQKCSQ